jgi:hypothetical protein
MSTWRDIPGYEGKYEVSDHGEVRNKLSGYIMKPNPRIGYCTVQLYANGKSSGFAVHCLVALAFLGERHIGSDGCYQVVNHIDGNKRNNRL